MSREHATLDFAVVCRPLEARLPPYSLTELRRWVANWSRADRPRLVVMGSCADTSCEDRAERLAVLAEALVDCGVPRTAISCTDDRLTPPPWVDAEGSHDVAWLKAIDAVHASRAVQSIRRLFDAEVDAAFGAQVANEAHGPREVAAA